MDDQLAESIARPHRRRRGAGHGGLLCRRQRRDLAALPRRRGGAPLPALRRRDRGAPAHAPAPLVDRAAGRERGQLPAPPAGRGQHRVRRRCGGRQPRPRADRGDWGPPLRRRLRSAGDAAPDGRVPGLRGVLRADGGRPGRRVARDRARSRRRALGRLAGVVAVERAHRAHPAGPAHDRSAPPHRGLARPRAARRRGGRARIGADRRQRAGVRAHVRPIDPTSVAPLLGAAVPAVERGPLRPPRDQRRGARRRDAVDLGGDQRARAVLAGLGEREPPRAAAVPAGRVDPLPVAGDADQATEPDRGGAGG